MFITSFVLLFSFTSSLPYCCGLWVIFRAKSAPRVDSESAEGPLEDLMNCGFGQTSAFADFLGTCLKSPWVCKYGEVWTFRFSHSHRIWKTFTSYGESIVLHYGKCRIHCFLSLTNKSQDISASTTSNFSFFHMILVSPPTF